MAELTPRKKIQSAEFVREFMVDGNATAAAIRCGCSEKSAHVQGWRLRHRPEVCEMLRVSIGVQNKIADADVKEATTIVEKVKGCLAVYALKEHPIEDITPDHSMKAADMLLKTEGAYQDTAIGIGGLIVNLHVGGL